MSAPSQDETFVKDIDEEDIHHKVDLDSILVNELGQFGNFQLRLMVLCVMAAIFGAWANDEYLFTTARMSSRCLIPECDSSTPEFNPPWLHNVVPGSPGALDNCQRFVRNSSHLLVNQTCPAALFDQNRVEGCVEYVYENTNTIVYDFGLACNEWKRTLIGFFGTAGTILALALTGYISDRWGRRTVLVITGFNCAWLGATRYFADTYIGFIISEFTEATFGCGIYTSAYILLIEVTGPKHRTAATAFMNTFWAVGQITLGVIAWEVPNWRSLTLALYIPQFATLGYYWVVPESVRWYMSKGRYKESEAVFQNIAKINGKTLSLRSFEALMYSAEREKQREELDKSMNVNEPWLIVLVFRHKRVLLRCLVVLVSWVTYNLINYGLSINAVNMLGNPHQNYMTVAAMDIPGLWLAVLLINSVGRRLVLTGAFWLCAVCQLPYIFIPKDHYGLSLIFYLLGKSSIAMVTTSLYIYTAELYPTKHRHTLFAFTTIVGEIGSVLAPLTPAFGVSTFEKFPFVLFSLLAFLSGILVFFTTETHSTKLPDTMEEAENHLRKKSDIRAKIKRQKRSNA